MSLREKLHRRGALSRGTRVQPNNFFAFEGGLNLVDPPVAVGPGQLIGVKNYEPGIGGGYTRVEGYERFDGQPSPARSDYWALRLVGTAPEPGDHVLQYPAGGGALIAEGICVTVHPDGDDWIVALVQGPDTPGFANGFASAGELYVGSTRLGSSGFAYRNGAPVDAINDDIVHAKAEYLRGFIQPVGGTLCSGPVRGVAIYLDRVVAWRDSADGTRGLMFTTGGGPFDTWQPVDLGHKLRFTAGASEPTEGVMVVGATSGANARVGRVVSDDGSFGSGDAAGFIVVGEISGTFAEGEPLQVDGEVVATLSQAEAQALPPGGKYRHRVHNFAGAGDQRRLYGVNGVGNGFEYDGETFVLIETGMADDRPNRIFVINDHLGLCYPGGSVQNSGFQRPLNYNPIVGADERSVGGEVTAVIEETHQAVIIATRQQSYILYGDVMENFQLRLFSSETGVISDTIARQGQTIYLDDRGFTTLKHTQAFGNFAAASLSDKILPAVQTELAGSGICGAVISRRKNLYRCFFANGTAFVISARPGNRFSGWTQIVYPHAPTCFDSGEVEGHPGIIAGQSKVPGPLYPERIFMGAANGYVYECDIGNSFDGQNIEHFARFTYNNAGSPEIYKHYRKAVIDVDVAGTTTLYATVDFNYGNRSGSAGEEMEFLGGGGLWDIANWDEFKWSGQMYDQVVLKTEGDGFNIGLFFYGSSNREPSHTLYNCTYHWSPRRINRGSQRG